jgi:predicted nucleic acid-binding protein
MRIASAAESPRMMISAVSVIELEHGYWRARTAEQSQRRRLYLDEVFGAIAAQPFTKEIAQLAAKIDAEARRGGQVIPFADLQIGVTALHFGFAMATLNVRHFEMIPGLVLQRL